MNPDEIFTLEELETLSKAYLDCTLSRAQEKELELVLYTTTLSSPTIDEAREMMSITTQMAEAQDRLVTSKRVRRIKPWWYAAGAVAACAVAIIIALPFISSDHVSHHGGEYVAVYVDGQRLSGEMAQAKAMEIQEASMAFLKRTMDEAANEQRASINYINSIKE